MSAPARLVSSRYAGGNVTALGAVAALSDRPADLIDFSIGDPDLTTDGRVIDAAALDAHAGHTHYTPVFGDVELRRAIVEFYRERYGHDRPLSDVMITTSACHAMWLVFEAILDDGDEVIIPEPCFAPYPHQVRLARGVPVFLPTQESDGFQPDPARLEATITDRTRAILINTPNNPTGACLSAATMAAIADIAERHDLLVVADDIYTIYTYEAPFVPFTTLPGMAERTITLNSFSKDFVMTGWRLGNVVAPAPIVTAMKDINENCVFTAPSVSQRAALAALRLRDDIWPALTDLYRGRIMTAYDEVCATPNMRALRPQGSIYLWVNVADTGLPAAEVNARMFRDAHVLAVPGEAFGPSGAGYLRLAVTVDEATIREAFGRLRALDIFGG